MRDGGDDDGVESRMRLVIICPLFLEYSQTLGLSISVIVSSMYIQLSHIDKRWTSIRSRKDTILMVSQSDTLSTRLWN